MAITGYVMQLQHFSVNDGEGIRTTIFLAGCPLRCKWCANPEGFDHRPKIAYYSKTCSGCGRCAAVCLHGIGINLNAPGNRDKCLGCGACVSVCPNGSRKQLISKMTVDEIVAAILPQLRFLQDSGGGVTFSGGEATSQRAFLHAAAKRFYDMGVNLALETCGYFDFDELAPTLSLFQLIFFDIKHMDDSMHQRFTGQSNRRILANLSRLAELPSEVVVRIPTIINVNADEDNIRSTARYVKQKLPKARIELLPYHNYGEVKYLALGMELPDTNFQTPKEEELVNLEAVIESEGVRTVRFR